MNDGGRSRYNIFICYGSQVCRSPKAYVKIKNISKVIKKLEYIYKIILRYQIISTSVAMRLEIPKAL